MTIDTIVGIVASLIGALSLIIFNMVRGDLKALSGKVEGIYGWADDRFVDKDVCRERHKG